MSRETLEREIVVDAPPSAVWANLIDVPRVAAWLPFLHSINEREPLSSYDAVLEDRVGPFALRADLMIMVVEIDEPRVIVVKAAGEDRSVRSRITIDAELRLSKRSDGKSEVVIKGTYEVTGKVARLSAGLIRSKARKMVDQFCIAAQEGLR
jgi:carbon monoxide dehydrogenase subunit G